MRALDLFCGAGGASKGLADAGFDVVGVDIKPQPNYPFEFFQFDAMNLSGAYLMDFDFIWASPPCQAYSRAQKLQKRKHPDLIAAVREKLKASGKPYCIENVEGSPLINPIMLCGAMFGLKTYRHRLFESNMPLVHVPHQKHTQKTAKMGRKPKPGEFMHVVGNFSGIKEAKQAMGIDWMTRDELREAIPPIYSEFIAIQIFTHEEASA